MSEPRLVGAFGGRVWHISANDGKWPQRTLCGLVANRAWRPGWQNGHPRTCAKCLKASKDGTK